MGSWCKSSHQLACDCRVRHKECCELLKHILKPYDNRSDRQFYILEIAYDFFMTRAALAIKIACDSLKQKSCCVNRPLEVLTFYSERQRKTDKKISSTIFRWYRWHRRTGERLPRKRNKW